jgi:DNA-binding HxlR family transcriptional regulator
VTGHGATLATTRCDEYLLTAAGSELTPVLGLLRAWGERYASPRVRGKPTKR